MPTPTGPSTAVIAVGNELLAGFTLDTNSHWLARQAFDAGRPVIHIEVVPDLPAEIAAAIRRAIASPADRIVVGGGLGPTPDDRTAAGVALGLDLPLIEDPRVVDLIRARLEALVAAGRRPSAEISEANRATARIPQGAVLHPNPVGMAPMLAYPLEGGRWLAVLPGVPREFTALCETNLIPVYLAGAGRPALAEIAYTGVPESEMAAPMRSLADEFPDLAIGSYPQSEMRRVLIRVHGGDAATVAAATRRLLELRPGGEVQPAG